MYRLILLLFLAMSSESCSLGSGSAPQDHFYRLPEVILGPQPVLYKNIVIKLVKSTGLYHERAILFIERDKPLELQRYHYSFWATTPAELVHRALYQGMQSSGLAAQVSRDVSENRPDLIIDTRIIHFERIIDAQSVGIDVALEVSVRTGHASDYFWTKRYHFNEKVSTKGMHATAELFGTALERISSELVEDLQNKK